MRTTVAFDRHGNRYAEEGLDRCACGSKYWEQDRCVDCGTPVTMRSRRSPEFGGFRHPAGGRLTATMYGGAYWGTPGEPNANPVLAAMREDDLKHDPWGTAMAWAFAVCDYLHHVALASDDIPEGLGYRPAATAVGEGFEDESHPEATIVNMGLDTFTLVQAAKCLDRYLDWCKAAGRDY